MIFFLSETPNKLDKIIAVPLNSKIINHPSLDKIFSEEIMDNKFIFLKGGAARLAMSLYLFNGQKTDYIRDVDYAFIGSRKDYEELTKDGYIEDLRYEGDTIERYMKYRDNTLNEVLLNRENLYFTRRALRDYKKKVINPKQKELSDRASARSLLFSLRYGNKISDEIWLEYNDEETFEYLVVFIKAVEMDLEEEFYQLCKEKFNFKHKSSYKWFRHMFFQNKTIRFNNFNSATIDFIRKLPNNVISQIEKNNPKIENLL